MSDYRKRSTKRRRQREATLIGDLFKILFAVSMLIVAILAAFFVFKNVAGFRLPDLRVTTEAVETSEEAGSIDTTEKHTEAAETHSTVPETAESASENAAVPEESEEEEAEKEIASVEASIEESRKAESEAKEPSSSQAESTVSKDKQDPDKDYEESDYTDEAEKPGTHPEKSGAVISDGPVVGTDTIKESPVAAQNDGAVISDGGPVAG